MQMIDDNHENIDYMFFYVSFKIVQFATKGTKVWCIKEFKIFRVLCHGKNLQK